MSASGLDPSRPHAARSHGGRSTAARSTAAGGDSSRSTAAGPDPSRHHQPAPVQLPNPDGEVTAVGQEPPATAPAAPALRAQLLATEHWSLLATRGTTWAEIMSRITIHLTVSSAALVVLALTAQATGFGPVFRVLSIGLASVILVLGTLTGLRVQMASAEDAVLVAGMNRLRAAYRDLDPGIEPYLVASWHDDFRGMRATYALGRRRSTFLHVVGSTAMFMTVVNTIVAGTLGALVADAAGAGTALVAVLGALTGLGYLAAMVELGRRRFTDVPGIPSHFPTPAD